MMVIIHNYSIKIINNNKMFLPVKVNLYWDCYFANDRYDEVKKTFDVNLVNPLFDKIICYYSSKNKNNYIPEVSEKVSIIEIRSPHPYFDDNYRYIYQFL